MNLDPQLLMIASRQEGLFSRRQATRCGYGDAHLRRRVRTGSIDQLSRDVFAVAGHEWTWRRRCRAALLAHPAAALSHDTAAAWRGLSGFPQADIHIAVPPFASHDIELATVHRTRHHQFEDLRGLRTTTFAQTLVQLAATHRRGRVEAALHSGLDAEPRNLLQLQERMAELRGRRLPGFRHLEELVDALDGAPPTASELERLLLTVLGEIPGLPEVRRQVRFPWRTDHDVIVDAFVPAWSLILEADGRRWHARVKDFEVDRWRDAEAAAHGLQVMRFTATRLGEDRAGVVDQIRRFGDRRTAPRAVVDDFDDFDAA